MVSSKSNDSEMQDRVKTVGFGGSRHLDRARDDRVVSTEGSTGHVLAIGRTVGSVSVKSSWGSLCTESLVDLVTEGVTIAVGGTGSTRTISAGNPGSIRSSATGDTGSTRSRTTGATGSNTTGVTNVLGSTDTALSHGMVLSVDLRSMGNII